MDPHASTPASRPAPPARRNKRLSAPPSPRSESPAIEASPSFPSSPQLPPQEEIDTADTIVAPSSPPMPVSMDDPGADESMSAAEMERAMAGLTRNDLFTALRRAKEEMDRLDSVVSTQSLEIETLNAAQHDLSTRLASHDDERRRLMTSITQREHRLDEMRAEHERVENDLYSRAATMDRLKQRAEEAERQCRQAEDRLAELGMASDREREYAQDQETLLRRQNERLGKECAGLKEEVEHLREAVNAAGSYDDAADEEDPQQDLSAADDVNGQHATANGPASSTSAALGSPQRPQTSRNRLAPSPRHNRARSRTFADESSEQSLLDDRDASAAALASVTEEVTQLKKTLASQDAALQEVRATLLKERSRSQDLEAEKKELESLAYGNTLQHLMGRRRRREQQSSQDDDDDDDEDDEDDTDASSVSASTSEQSSSGTEANDEEEEDNGDDVPDTPSTPKASKRTTSKAERRKSGGLRTASGRMRRRASLTEIPESLSQELLQPNNADANTSTSTAAPLSTATEGDELASLRREVAHLRSENKGLSLYISKILNRILSMEGFERVLAADYTGPWGSVRGKRNAQAQVEWQEKQSPKKRASILPAGFVGRASPANAAAGDDVDSDAASTKSVEKAKRRQSSGILGFGGANAASSSSASTASTTAPTGDAAAAASSSLKKKAGRASVDWKSLRMPWSSSSPTAETPPPNSNLRPFALKSGSSGPSESTPYAASKRAQSSSSSTTSSTGGASPLPGAAAGADTSLSSLSSPLLSIDTSTLSAGSAHDDDDADEDELERRRARSLLEMEGHKVPDHQLTPSSPRVGPTPTAAGGMTTSATATGGFGAFFARVLGNTAPAAGAAPGAAEPQTPRTQSVTSSSPASSPQKERKTATDYVDHEADSSLTQPPSGTGKGSASGRVRPSRRSMSAVLAVGDEDDEQAEKEAARLSKSMAGLGVGVDTSVAGDESYAMPPSAAGRNERGR